jgi:hypothetical protein
MIVDYNYKPYVYSAPPGITFYAPPAKNNKGVIVLTGLDNLTNIYNPQITFLTPSGDGLVMSLDAAGSITSGSIYDMFMQFRRESTAPSTVTKTSEISMIPYQAAAFTSSFATPFFIPMTYLSMTFTVVGTPSSWTRALTIITLY